MFLCLGSAEFISIRMVFRKFDDCLILELIIGTGIAVDISGTDPSRLIFRERVRVQLYSRGAYESNSDE